LKKHLIIVSVVAAVLSAGLAYLSMHTDLIPHPASLERNSIENLSFLIAIIFCLNRK
jgi:hypothetical protein